MPTRTEPSHSTGMSWSSPPVSRPRPRAWKPTLRTLAPRRPDRRETQPAAGAAGPGCDGRPQWCYARPRWLRQTACGHRPRHEHGCAYPHRSGTSPCLPRLPDPHAGLGRVGTAARTSYADSARRPAGANRQSTRNLEDAGAVGTSPPLMSWPADRTGATNSRNRRPRRAPIAPTRTLMSRHSALAFLLAINGLRASGAAAVRAIRHLTS